MSKQLPVGGVSRRGRYAGRITVEDETYEPDPATASAVVELEPEPPGVSRSDQEPRRGPTKRRPAPATRR